jgi:hypothetical protein
LDWFPEESYWSGLDEAPFDTREIYGDALRGIDGDFPFTQPPLKVVEYDSRSLTSSIGLREDTTTAVSSA